jgi:hypothetical protein
MHRNIENRMGDLCSCVAEMSVVGKEVKKCKATSGEALRVPGC